MASLLSYVPTEAWRRAGELFHSSRFFSTETKLSESPVNYLQARVRREGERKRDDKWSFRAFNFRPGSGPNKIHLFTYVLIHTQETHKSRILCTSSRALREVGGGGYEGEEEEEEKKKKERNLARLKRT